MIYNKVDCPMCLNSSGIKPFVYPHRSQVCEDCNGSGKVSKTKFKKLKAIYGDLING